MDEAQAPAESDNLVRWYFVPLPKPLTQSVELRSSRARTYLYESLYRCMTKHNLHESFQLLKVLPKETTFDPNALLRFVMILIESNPSHIIGKNLIIYLEAMMSRLDISKTDAFVEFLAYFIRHNRIDDAKELFSERGRYMARPSHRLLPYVDVNVRCYEFYLTYLDWIKRINSLDIKPVFDISTQGWLVNAIDCLKTVTLNYEFFVICILRVLLYYGYHKKAYLFMSEYQHNNPNNFGAQLALLNVLKRLEAMTVVVKTEQTLDPQQDVQMTGALSWEQRLAKRAADLQAINNFAVNSDEDSFEFNVYPLEEDYGRIMDNLRTLDPGSKELMQLTCAQNNRVETLKDLMDGLEVISEIKNITRWEKIRTVIEDIMASGNDEMVLDARLLWHTRYRRFWLPVDFESLAQRQVSSRDLKFIGETLRALTTFLDQPIVL